MIKQTVGKESLIISDRTGIYNVPLAEIIRFESQGTYSVTHAAMGEKYISCKGLGAIFKEISEVKDFFRIHNSHIINLTKIKMYKKINGGAVVMTDGSEVPVSRRRKSAFLKKMYTT